MTSPARSIGWALYGACSWTWCIGLFLPVLLMQWFGWTGFLLIAIPNILGATAMGLLLGSPGESRRFCARHATAIEWFALVTIGFHLFFLAMIGLWMIAPAMRTAADWWLFPAAGLVLAALGSLVPRRAWPILGIAGFAMGVFVFVNQLPGGIAGAGWSGTRAGIDLLWLAPVFVLGFLLCPWLDAPFHRVRQETSGKGSFLLLGAAFAFMLVVTASYWRIGAMPIPEVVLAWLLVQSVFTIAANLQELRIGVASRPHGQTRTGTVRWGTLVAIVGVSLPAVMGRLGSTVEDGLDMYLRWLAIYGLVFPAVVLSLNRADRWLLVTLLIGAALVLGEFGFIGSSSFPSAAAEGRALLGALAVLPVLAIPLCVRSRTDRR